MIAMSDLPLFTAQETEAGLKLASVSTYLGRTVSELTREELLVLCMSLIVERFRSMTTQGEN